MITTSTHLLEISGKVCRLAQSTSFSWVFKKNNFKACSWGNSLTGGPWPCVCPSFGCSPLCLPSLHILFVPAYFAPLLDYCYSNKTFIFSKHLRAHFEINVVLTISDLIWHLADEQTLTFGERTVFNHTYSN